MKRIAVAVIIGLLLFAAPAMAARVMNLELSYQDGTTVARIDVQGQVRFVHETEVPKNGRPHRVIVDILSATHELGAKEFLELPNCAIKDIRTSQYAVSPEKIVRVVFDMYESPIYQVVSDSRSITLLFTRKNTRSFGTWSTSATVASAKANRENRTVSTPSTSKPSDPVIVAASSGRAAKEKNKAIEKDRLLSLEGSDKPKKQAVVKGETAPGKPAITAVAESESVPVVPWKAVATSTEPLTSKTSKKATAVEKTAGPKAVSSVAAASTPQPVTKSAPKQSASKGYAAADTPKKQAASDSKKAEPEKVVARSEPSPAPAKEILSEVTKGQQVLAQKVTVDRKSKPTEKQAPATSKPAASVETAESNDERADIQGKRKSTSRFRRSAASAKIRGTMVAEFPKRLVIKYKSDLYRDPFKTLIDDTRTYNNPIERRVPNVEGLRLVGVIESTGRTNRALFEDKEGYSYMLESGNKVRNGYVLRVESDRVYFQIFEYGWSRTVAMRME